MQTEEIIKMCRSLARRFKNYNEYEDLISEGMVAIYEHLAKEPKAQPVRLYRVARTRMHDYLNIDSLPVTVPASDVARKLARDLEANVDSTWSDGAVEHLRLTLMGEYVEPNESHSVAPSSEEIYEEKEFHTKLQKRLAEELTSDEQLLLYMRYTEAMTQRECADFWGVGRTAIEKREAKLFQKMSSIVTEMQQSK